MKVLTNERRAIRDRKMTKVINALYRAGSRQEGVVDDIHVHGAPRECYTMAWRHFNHRINGICEEAGFHREEIYEEIVQRTNAKWAYNNFGWLGDEG